MYEFSNSASHFNDSSGTEACYTQANGLKDTGVGIVYRTAELVPDNMSEAKKLNSFTLKLTNPNGAITANAFVIDDITVIYREHSTK